MWLDVNYGWVIWNNHFDNIYIPFFTLFSKYILTNWPKCLQLDEFYIQLFWEEGVEDGAFWGWSLLPPDRPRAAEPPALEQKASQCDTNLQK